MNTTSSTHELPADIRQVVVRHFGAALAAAWRAKYAGTDESPHAGETRRAGSITGMDHDRSTSEDSTR